MPSVQVHCSCGLAFALDAAQHARTRQLLDNGSPQLQQEIDVQKSRSCLASLMGDMTRNTIAAASQSGKPFSASTLQSMTATASAQAVAASFHPSDNTQLVQQLRKEISHPTTKVHLPVPINIGGNSTAAVDTRGLLSRKSSYREHNNRLLVDESAQLSQS